MTQKNRWKLLNDFEAKQRIIFLKRLKPQQSLKIYSHLYDFFYRIWGKRYSTELNTEKIRSLVKVRSVLQKANL